jgi:hypothetical protein
LERQWRQIWFGVPENSGCAVSLKGEQVADRPFFADDRFIAKELSRAELQAMEKFAPAYFDYMSSAVSANVSNQVKSEVPRADHYFSARRSWPRSLVATSLPSSRRREMPTRKEGLRGRIEPSRRRRTVFLLWRTSFMTASSLG